VILQTNLKRLSAVFCLSLSVFVVFAGGQAPRATPRVIYGPERAPAPVAAGRNLFCAGFVQLNGISTENKIIGADNEADAYNFKFNDYLYINSGADKGVKVGDVYSVIRPRGQVESRWTKKDVGFYVQELGAIEVIDVQATVSVAKVISSCDSILLGDLIQISQVRTSPLSERRAPLDLFADRSGRSVPRGRIMMGRDNVEMLARDFIAYIDVGADENLQVGDRLRIYRTLGKGNIMQKPQEESVSARDEGFQSDTYRGGKFSNQAARKRGETADGRVVTTYEAKEFRSNGGRGLRKIVGEAVVLNVKERAATVVIVSNAQEIHTGDWVELQ
jgi:hypothetical protein